MIVKKTISTVMITLWALGCACLICAFLTKNLSVDFEDAGLASCAFAGLLSSHLSLLKQYTIKASFMAGYKAAIVDVHVGQLKEEEDQDEVQHRHARGSSALGGGVRNQPYTADDPFPDDTDGGRVASVISLPLPARSS